MYSSRSVIYPSCVANFVSMCEYPQALSYNDLSTLLSACSFHSFRVSENFLCLPRHNNHVDLLTPKKSDISWSVHPRVASSLTFFKSSSVYFDGLPFVLAIVLSRQKGGANAHKYEGPEERRWGVRYVTLVAPHACSLTDWLWGCQG